MIHTKRYQEHTIHCQAFVQNHVQLLPLKHTCTSIIIVMLR